MPSVPYDGSRSDQENRRHGWRASDDEEAHRGSNVSFRLAEAVVMNELAAEEPRHGLQPPGRMRVDVHG